MTERDGRFFMGSIGHAARDDAPPRGRRSVPDGRRTARRGGVEGECGLGHYAEFGAGDVDRL